MGEDTLLNIGAFAIQVSVIAAAATALLAIMRIASPEARYVCWRVALIACLAMPLVLQRPAEPVAISAGGQPELALVEYPAVPDGPIATEDVASGRPWDALPWGVVAASVLLLGIVVRGAWLALGLWRLRRLRRSGHALIDPDYDELQRALNTRAEIRSVAGLEQPATCGLRRPVVLLPESLAAAPAPTRRAVVTHELFHVQRRDWAWVLMEESLRTALWFHPAIAWLVSRIQLAREELVDELTVLATGNRRAYIEALLAFADGGRVRPAPAFARRRHLFTRIVRLSKEQVMSSPRIVVSAAAVVVAVLATSWYAGSLFPIVTAAPTVPAAAPSPAAAAAPATVAPALRVTEPQAIIVTGRSESPRAALQGARSGGAARPGPAAAPAPGAQTKPLSPENPIPRRLSSVPVRYPAELIGSGLRGTVVVRVTLDASGAVADVQRISAQATAVDSSEMQRALAAFPAATIEAVRQWRYAPPADPPIGFFVAARFEREGDAVAMQSEGPMSASLPVLNREQLLEAERRLELLRKEREQLAAQPGAQASIAELDDRLSALAREFERAVELQGRADALRAQAAALRAQAAGTATGLGVRSGGPFAVSTPGTAQAVASAPARTPLVSPSGVAPIRIGGNVRPPTKTRDVPPEYPEIAKVSRVQGVVILEVLIDEQGRVADARILRSIPLLDQAALDAVRQWEFTPTLLNGAPVPVLMTVTTQFTLSQ